jgi:hypothetical protein
MLREEINSFRDKTHSETYKGRAEMTEVLDRVIKGRPALIDVSEVEDKIIAISKKYWRE